VTSSSRGRFVGTSVGDGGGAAGPASSASSASSLFSSSSMASTASSPPRAEASSTSIAGPPSPLSRCSTERSRASRDVDGGFAETLRRLLRGGDDGGRWSASFRFASAHRASREDAGARPPRPPRRGPSSFFAPCHASMLEVGSRAREVLPPSTCARAGGVGEPETEASAFSPSRRVHKNKNTAVPRMTRRRRLGRDFLAASPHIRARASMVAFGSSSDTGRAPRRAPRGVASPGAAPPSSSGKPAPSRPSSRPPPARGKENDARALTPSAPRGASQSARAPPRRPARDASRGGSRTAPPRARPDATTPSRDAAPPPGATPVKNLLFEEGPKAYLVSEPEESPPPPRGLSRPPRPSRDARRRRPTRRRRPLDPRGGRLPSRPRVGRRRTDAPESRRPGAAAAAAVPPRRRVRDPPPARASGRRRRR
jgi:hypothetical protein